MSTNIVYLDLNRLFYIDQLVYQPALKEILDSVQDQLTPTTQIVVGMWSEYRPHDVRAVLTILTPMINNPLLVILEKNYEEDSALFNQYTVTYLHMWAMVVNSAKSSSQQIKKWDGEHSKFLLLTGNLARINRINLLHVLYKDNLLINGIFSFPILVNDRSTKTEFSNIADGADIAELKEFSKLADNEFTELFDYCIKHRTEFSPINTNYVTKIIGAVNNSTVSQFEDAVNNTCIDIISEAIVAGPPCASEKTYRTILQNHPFILAGAPGGLHKLNTLGFKTFEKYLADPNYDLIEDPYIRNTAIKDNVKYFLDNFKKDIPAIAADVEYNSNHYAQLIEQDTNYLAELASDNNVTAYFSLYNTTIWEEYNDFIVYATRYSNMTKDMKFTIKYNELKGSDWPNCSARVEYELLPSWIKDECIEFGLVVE